MAEPAYEVLFTQGADDDLESLYDYLAEHRSQDEAQALLDAILAKVTTLERFPRRGALPRVLAVLGIRDFHQILHRPYRLIYRIAGDKVFVTLIADSRRDMQALLARRLLGG